MQPNIEKEFEIFKKKYGKDAFLRWTQFLDEFRQRYQKQKIKEYLKNGYNRDEAKNKSRQSWVAFLKRQICDLIFLFLIDICKQLNLKIIKRDILEYQPYFNSEVSLVRRKVVVHFGEYSLLPEGDLVIYKQSKNDIKIISVLTIKNSYRKAFPGILYWKLKFLQDEITRPTKIILILTEKRLKKDLFTKKKELKDWLVMEYELDSIYITNEIEDEGKIKSIQSLKEDLKSMAKI